jgi:O-antigen/teichoic acid export membrane protein
MGGVTESPKPLGRRIVRGSVWTAARQGVQQACSMITLVLVARLVPPAEVGLFAMAMLVLTIARALTETGIETALIQRSEIGDDALDTGFTIVLVRAVLLGALLAAGAPLFAGFFDEPRVTELVRALALSVALEGLANNRVAMFQRELDFRRYFHFHAAGQVAGLLATVAAALVLRNVWAIVVGQIAAAAARVLASYALAQRRPKLRLEREIALELFRYGRWVGASSVLLFLLVQGDNLFIGKLIGATALAHYAWAYQLANLPALFITQILASVMFPAYAAVRDEPSRLGELLVRSMRLTLVLALPSAVLIAVLAEAFTRALLGDRWLPIVPITHALATFGAMRALGASAGPLFLAIGRPELRTKIQVAQLAIFAASIYPLYLRYGVLGVAWSVSAYGLLSVYAAVLCFRLCEAPLARMAKPCAQVVTATAAGALVAWLIAQLWLGRFPLAGLLLGGAAAVGVIAIVLALLDRRADDGYRLELNLAWKALRPR